MLIKDVLDTYLGKYAKLFVFLGTDQNPVKLMMGDPIIGLIKDEDQIVLFVDDEENLIVNLADPNGQKMVESALDQLFDELYQDLDVEAEIKRLNEIKLSYSDLNL